LLQTRQRSVPGTWAYSAFENCGIPEGAEEGLGNSANSF
jgi:hypothetical protein